MFRDTLTADGYTNCIEVPQGGAAEIRITYNSGTGTTTFKRAHKNAAKGTANGYQEFDSSTTVTASTALGIQLSEGLYCFQVSSGSSPNITVELASADFPTLVIKDSGTEVA